MGLLTDLDEILSRIISYIHQSPCLGHCQAFCKISLQKGNLELMGWSDGPSSRSKGGQDELRHAPE